jgi:CBS domain-containing protein
MTRPRMNGDRTAVDRVTMTTPLTTTTSINEAYARLHATGEVAAVVVRRGRPVGVVTAAALTSAATASRPDEPICTIMDYVVVLVDREAGASGTVRSGHARKTSRNRDVTVRRWAASSM